MKTINQIKQECMDIDISNLDQNIGVYVDGRIIQFRDVHDVELHYSNISIDALLRYYYSYMGLGDVTEEEISSYAIDIRDLVNMKGGVL